jgi:hypothetical protein
MLHLVKTYRKGIDAPPKCGMQAGWWVGLADGESDPYGRIINISPSYGRLIAKGYTAR